MTGTTRGVAMIRTGIAVSLMTTLAILHDKLPPGDVWLVIDLWMVGAIYVLRDHLQRLCGEVAVLVPMAVIVGLVYASSPYPYASASALMLGMTFGWAAYCQSRDVPPDQRVLISGIVAVLVDGCIYLALTANLASLIHDSALKVVPVLLYFLWLRAVPWQKKKKNP